MTVEGMNDEVEICYSLLQLTAPAPVSVGIYDLSGGVVWEQRDRQGSGEHSVQWDGRDRGGKRVIPGVYVYRIVANMKDRSYAHAGTFTILY